MPSGGRAYPLVLLAGALLSLAFPEPDVAPLAWVALVPLLLAASGGEAGRGARLGLVFGLGFFGTLLIWISIVGYVAWAMLVLLQAAFLALFGASWAWLSRHPLPWFRVLLATALWVTIEFLRGSVPLGGFTWGQLAQSQHDLFFWTLRPAAFGGGWLVAGLVVAVNATIAEGVRAAGKGRLIAAAGVVSLLGAPLLIPVSSDDGPVMRTAVVQGNVPQDFSGSFYDKELAITESHADLTRRLDGADLDLVVWPESSVGLDLQRDPTAAAKVVDAARAVGVPMIVGGNLDIDRQRYKVVAFHVAPDGAIVDVYQKTHLVPFGEYVPARDLLDWLPILDQVPRDAVPGEEPVPFDLPRGRVSTVISFEGDFGPLVRESVAEGGDLLVVATNTSTWGHSWASAQHVAFSQVRAAENGIAVAHAALSGISAFIDHRGRVLESSDLYEATTLSYPLSLTGGSFYTRTGEWFPGLCAVVVLAAIVSAFRRRTRGTSDPAR